MDEDQYLNSNKENMSQNIEKPRNSHNFGEIKTENFDDSLTISDIAQDAPQTPIKEEKNLITEDFSEDLDNINEDEFTQRKLSDCSIQMEEFKNDELNIDVNTNVIKKLKNKRTEEDISKRYTRKLTKEEMGNIPLPVFSCIYCINMVVAFKHLSKEIVTNKYLFQTSIYDLKDINKLIIYQPLIDKDKKMKNCLILLLKVLNIYITIIQKKILKIFSAQKIILIFAIMN